VSGEVAIYEAYSSCKVSHKNAI